LLTKQTTNQQEIGFGHKREGHGLQPCRTSTRRGDGTSETRALPGRGYPVE